MDIIEKIKAFLATPDKDRNYKDGIALYSEIARNRQLVRRMELKPDGKTTKDKLIYLIEQHVKLSEAKTNGQKASDAKVIDLKATVEAKEKAQAQQAADEAAENEKSKAERFSAEEFLALPDAVKAIETVWKEKFDQRKFLRHTLEAAENDEVRAEMAATILKLSEEIQTAHDSLDYFKANGQLPEVKPATTEPAQDVADVDLNRVISNLRSTLAKSKKKGTLNDKQQAAYDANSARLEELVKRQEKLRANA